MPEISIHDPAISILVLPAVARVSLRIIWYADHTSTFFSLSRNGKEECIKKASWCEWPLQKRERESAREGEGERESIVTPATRCQCERSSADYVRGSSSQATGARFARFFAALSLLNGAV